MMHLVCDNDLFEKKYFVETLVTTLSMGSFVTSLESENNFASGAMQAYVRKVNDRKKL